MNTIILKSFHRIGENYAGCKPDALMKQAKFGICNAKIILKNCNAKYSFFLTKK